MAELENDPELYQTIEDDIALGIDPVVPSNLFGLEQFDDLDTPDLLN